MTVTIHPMITIHAETKTKVVFERLGKIYCAAISTDADGTRHVIEVTSHGAKFKRFNRDRAHALYASIEEVLS